MKVCVINTGGTISCVGDPLAPMSAERFAQASELLLNPILAEVYPDTELVYETSLAFPESSTHTLDSTNLQPSDWCLMAQFILEQYTDYDGFVILHGTDSMDFTGSALPFLLNVFDSQGFGTAVLSKPVIITGSQVPMFYEKSQDAPVDQMLLNFNTDAYQNFCGAVACARLGVPEVGVYFDSKLYRGNRVLKVNASEFRAFESPNYPPLAQIGIEIDLSPSEFLPGPVSPNVALENNLSAATSQLEAIQNAIDANAVMQFNAFPAWYNGQTGEALIANLLDACVGVGIKGLVLESYGEGNFPSGNPDHPTEGGIYKALSQANADGVVLIDCTQVIAGTVNDSAYASGAWLPSVGALSGFDMTPMVALAKSMILLSAAQSQGWSADEVKTLIGLDLTGEVSSTSRLDSRRNRELLAGQSIAALDGSATLINDPKQGPQLKSQDGVLLWAPRPGVATPGRLVMQNDGNLVIYDDHNTPIWATDTGVFGGASSALMLTGSYGTGSAYGDQNLKLCVYDYSGGRQTATLYQQSTGSERASHTDKGSVMSSSKQGHTFRYSGRAASHDTRHQVLAEQPPGELINPNYVYRSNWGWVAQYAEPVRSTNAGYDPAGDCQGYFMSYKYQANNNCYAYGTNIAANSFPQPGRYSDGPDIFANNQIAPADVIIRNAQMDGLEVVGTTIQEVLEFAASSPPPGHFVALMYSKPESNIGGDPNANWSGDYHWARCDCLEPMSWSQKDGGDQVTNFDFAGAPITDPSTANWTVNQGPIGRIPSTGATDKNEYVVAYEFCCFMFVADGRVNIL